MEELAKKLADRGYIEAELLDKIGAGGKTERIEGMELRALRKLLDEVDPRQGRVPRRRVKKPDHISRWLCKEHAEKYRK